MTGRICNIQPFSIHDGPGIRTVFFMKGCNLRCFWCHNPESQELGTTMAFYSHKCIGCGACAEVCPKVTDGKIAILTDACISCGKCTEECFAEAIEMIGKEITVDEAVKILAKDKNIFAESGGGVTFSGGEPLLQPDFVAEVMKKCQELGIGTAIESALSVPWENIEKVLPYCDSFICDIKHADSEMHKRGTGAGNERILENLSRLAKSGKLYEIRTPVIPTFNDCEDDIIAIRDIVKGLGGDIKYTLLPFHKICASKYESQGRRFEAANIPEPTKEQIERLNLLIQ